MKRLALMTLGLIFLLPFLSDAQISIGVHGGIHTNKVQVTGIAEAWKPKNDYFTSYNFGIFAEIPMLNGFSFQPGLNFVEKGFRVNANTDFDLGDINIPIGVEARPRLNYLEMPLLLKYTYGEGPMRIYGFAGPHFSYAMDGKVDLIARAIVDFKIGTIDMNLDNNIYERFEVGGIVGLGTNFDTGPVQTFIQGSFQHGFTNMLDDPIIDIRLRNYGFNLTAGIQYAF